MTKRCLLFCLSLGLVSFPLLGCDSDDETKENPQEKTQENPQENPEDNPQENPQDNPQENDEGLKINAVRSLKPHATANVDKAALQTFVKGQYDLNFELLKNSNEQINNKNAMISTFSIQSALGMTWAGAAGDTAAEMKKALHFDDNTHQALNNITAQVLDGRLDALDTEFEKRDKVDVAINNDLYLSPNYTWKESWLDALSINYDAGLTEMNFAADPEGARKYINDVVSNDTHERIKDLIPPNAITKSTQFVLTNAIYFKAPWAYEMYQNNDPFTFNLLDNSTVKATSIGVNESMLYAKGTNYQAVSVPLRGDHFNMMFIVPDEGEYSNVESTLTGDFMNTVYSSLESQQVRLSMPEFTFETSLDLVKPFQTLGMKKAFTAEADFSGMTVEDNNSLFIGAIVHKSFIGVNKDGVEAAAATAVVGKDSAMPTEPIILAIDRPFIFMVYEKETNSPLFVGRLLDPTQK